MGAGHSTVWHGASQSRGSYFLPHRRIIYVKVGNLCKALIIVPGIKLQLNKWLLLLAVIIRSRRINTAHLPGVLILLDD